MKIGKVGRIVFLSGLTVLPGMVLASSLYATDYKLVRTTVDPDKKLNRSEETGAEKLSTSASEGTFTWSQTWKDAGKEIANYSFTITFDRPPDVIVSGQPFPLRLTVAASGGGEMKERPTQLEGRFDVPGDSIARATAGQPPYGKPFVGSATGSRDYKVPADFGDFDIVAVATLWGAVAVYHYEPVKPGETTTTTTVSSPRPGAGKDPCESEGDALSVASLKARLAWSKLQTGRQAIESLNEQWENSRQAAYWSGTLDVALMAGSVLAKPLSLALGQTVVSQSLKVAVVEGAVKGMIVSGMKKFNDYLHGRSLDPAEVLAAIAEKGEAGAGKALNDYAMKEIGGELLESIATEKMAPEFKGLLMREFVEPAAKFAGLMMSLESALKSAWTDHGRLENLRLAIKILRDREIVDSRQWEGAMGDLDVARSSFNHCQSLHPESALDPRVSAEADFRPEPSTGGASRPFRRTAERDPTKTAVGSPSAGPSVVLPYGSASLGLREGSVVVTSVAPDDYYAKQGVVAGAKLISIDFEPFSARTLEELKKLLSPADKEMLVLEFLLPDGRKINLPIPVERSPESASPQ